MSDIEEEAKLNKITRLLETGGTMLAQHCESCGAPMFRYKGNVQCPICDFPEETASKTGIKPAKSKGKSETPPAVKIPVSIGDDTRAPQTPQFYGELRPPAAPGLMTQETDQFIKSTIINKIVQLCLDLQRETDLGRIKQQLEAIESATRALNNISR